MKTPARTLDLFEVFARLGRPASLTELAAEMQVPVSSCFALVKALEAAGYLYMTRDRGPLYPTGRFAQIASLISQADPLTERVLNTLVTLRDRFDETACAGILRGPQVVYLHVVETRRSVRYAPRIGETRPAHANSIGKAILARMSPTDRKRSLSDLTLDRLTDRTLTSRDALSAKLDAAQQKGWHTNLGESDDDLAAVSCAMPVNGVLVGFSVAGPIQRIEAADPDRIGATLRDTLEQSLS
jgi:DNA-binding IclR family transcriptional regulator